MIRFMIRRKLYYVYVLYWLVREAHQIGQRPKLSVAETEFQEHIERGYLESGPYCLRLS